MSKPTEHKTVQARILAYAEAIGWTLVSQKEAEQRRGFDPETPVGYGGTSREFVEGRPLPRHHPHSPSRTDARECPGRSLQTFLTAENAKSTKNLKIHPLTISAFIAIQPPSAKQIFR
jgi:hypothetical protein